MAIKRATKPIYDDVTPLPGENQASAPAGLGHNKPPLEEIIPAEFRAELLRDRPDFLARLDQLVEASERAQAIDDETLGRCGDLVNAYRALLKHIIETHKTVKEPHLLAGRLVDAEKNSLTERVEAAKRKVEGIGNTFVAEREARLRAERERIAAEERAAAERAAAAERERQRAEEEAARAAANAANAQEREEAERRAAAARAEAEEAQAAAALAASQQTKVEPVRSDAGAAVSGKQEWVCQVEDFTRAFKHVKSDPKVQEAVEAAIKRLVRAGQRELAGVKIWPVAKANFR